MMSINLTPTCSKKPGSLAVTRRQATNIIRVSASANQINPSIRKSEEKVVDFVKVSELKGPKAVYCRCWRSGKFPLCDGAHVKHNKETGDNVGPLVIENTPASN